MKIKEWMKKRLENQPLGRTVYASVMLALFFLKCLNFYTVINVGDYFIPLACATTLFLMIVHFVILVFAPKAANVVLTVLYFILSILMSVDMVYYRYMGKLPAVALLKVAGQLTHVTGSIEQLINLRTLIPILDLALWILVLATRPVFKNIRLKPIKGWIQPASVGALTLCTALLLCGSFLFGSFKMAYLPNEMLLYHALDIKNAFFTKGGDINKDSYFKPVQFNNSYYGLAEGRNVFVIQVEALQSFVIGAEFEGQPLTPNLNALLENDSLYFENYYYQVGGGNTSDAEFAVNNSLYPRDDTSVYQEYADNTYYGLPWILKDNGYSTAAAFHGYEGDFWNRNTAYVTQGFDDYTSLEDFRLRDDYDPSQERIMGISDRMMFNQTLNIVKEYEEPFYSFIVTLSTHSPFSVPWEDRYVDKDNMSPNLYTLYIQSIAYFDRVLGEFLAALDAEGLYDNSIFVIYGDHYALTNTEADLKADVEELIGKPYDLFERFRVPLIIHIPGMEHHETIDTVGSHIDVLPTLLCLLGMENNKSVMFGHNLLDPDYEGVVYQMTHMQKGSFILKDAIYMYTVGGINSTVEARNGASADINDPEYLRIIEEAQKAIADSRTLLDNNDVLID